MAEGIDFQTLADHVGKVLGTEDGKLCGIQQETEI